MDEMAALRAAKKELRGLVQNRLLKLSERSNTEQSTTIAATLKSMPAYQAAKRVGIYLSMPHGEASTRAIVEDALEQRKQVFVPYLYDVTAGIGAKRRKAMTMVELTSQSDYEDTCKNVDAWGIPSVKPESLPSRHNVLADGSVIAQEEAPSEDKGPGTKTHLGSEANCLDLIIMPGVAFDRRCGRLGHGKGFYDIFLHQYESRIAESRSGLSEDQKGMPFLVGLALKEQITDLDQEVPTDSSDWRLDAVVTGNGSIIELSNS